MSTSLKKPRRADLVLGAVDQDAVVGVALGHLQLAADDVVQGAGVADDVDALDVDARAFADLEVDVDGAGLAVGRVARADVDEGEARGAGGEGQGVGGRLDLVGPGRSRLSWIGSSWLQDVAVQLLQLGLDLSLPKRYFGPSSSV